jgi:hypothetical protein
MRALPALFLVACATDPSGPGACPDADSAQWTVDGTAMNGRLVTGSPTGFPSEIDARSASLQLAVSPGDGSEAEVFVALVALAVGTAAPSASQGIEYREYPPSPTPRPPSLTIDASGSQLAGRVTTFAVAAVPGDAICGRFDLTAIGSKTIHVEGEFHHVLAAPQPGSR